MVFNDTIKFYLYTFNKGILFMLIVNKYPITCYNWEISKWGNRVFH